MIASRAKGVEEGTIPWWLVLLEGISLVILGILFLSSPAMTTILVVRFLGIYWLISGIFRIISIFLDRTMWGWKLIGGLIGILAGLVVLEHPLWSPLVIGSTIVIILGIEGIIYGGIGLFQAFRGAGWGAGIIGIISILFGIILLANVTVAALSLPLIIGLMALAGGIIAIIMAFRLR